MIEGDTTMTVKELIKVLLEFDLNSQVIVQYMKGDLYGSAWEDVEDFDKDDVIVKGNTVILDISDK